MYSVRCTVYSVQCTVYSVQCTLYSIQCTAVYSAGGCIPAQSSGQLHTAHTGDIAGASELVDGDWWLAVACDLLSQCQGDVFFPCPHPGLLPWPHPAGPPPGGTALQVDTDTGLGADRLEEVIPGKIQLEFEEWQNVFDYNPP